MKINVMTINSLARDHIKFCKEKGLPVESKDLDFLFTRIQQELDEVKRIRIDIVEGIVAVTEQELQEELVDVFFQTIQALAVIDMDIESAIKRKIEINKKRVWNKK